MSNELQEFLSFLGRIVLWVFEWTINVICFCIFLVSLCFIWRTIWILKDVFNNTSIGDFRIASVAHLGLAILDILVCPFAVISLVIPTRYVHTIRSCAKAYNNSSNYADFEYVPEVRYILFINAWIGLLDLFCLSVGILSMAMPTRFFAFCRILTYHFDDYLDDNYCKLRKKLVYNFIFGILDILVIPQGVLSIFIPTRTYHFFKQFKKIYTGSSQYDYVFNDREHFSYNLNYRWLFFNNLWLGILDIIVFVFGILSLLFPTRLPSFFRAAKIFWSDYIEDEYGRYRWFLFCNLFFALLDLITFVQCLLLFPILLIRYFNLKQGYDGWNEIEFPSISHHPNKISYDLGIRLWLIGNIYKGLIDVIFVPLLILDMLSIYNGIEIYHSIIDCSEWTNSKTNKIRIQIVLNFVILLFDIICMLPLLVFIVLTMYRIPNIYQQWTAAWKNYFMLRQNYDNIYPVMLPQHKSTRLFIFYQFISIFADIPCLLMIIFVFATIFRANKLYNKLTSDNTSANRKRLHCLYQTVFVFRDLVFFIPFY